eukprot:1146504-Prymnesium_polylepis.1
MGELAARARGAKKGGGMAFSRFTSVRPPYYPTALVATTERPKGYGPYGAKHWGSLPTPGL